MRKLSAIFFACLFFYMTRLSAGSLVYNGGFEQGMAGWEWAQHGAQATGEVDCTVSHSGKCSFKITNKSGQQGDVYSRIVQYVPGLQPFTTYKVSCWVKGQGSGNDWIGGGPGWYQRTAFPTGDFDWRPITFEIHTDADADNYDLMVLTESQTKALWVDDVEFIPIATDDAKKKTLEAQVHAQLAQLEQRAQALANTNNAYIRLGKTVAERFIRFAHGGSDGRMSPAWTTLQLEEVSQVLEESEKIARQNSPLLNWPPPKVGKVTRRGGTFFNNGRPWCFYGYGHFSSVIDDLPDFPALGASLIQDGRAGPSSMSADGTLGEGALDVLRGMDRAAQCGMRVDFLLSPHYYPAWAQAPDVPNSNIGFINFNIFHPKAQAAIAQWAAAMGQRIKDKPALHSVCLANEPVYNQSGTDKYTRPLFVNYLKSKHHNDLPALNRLYGTAYATFDEIPTPACAMPASQGAKRAFYDWTCFNKLMFANWHAWMGSILKSNGVTAPTHSKIMVFQTLDRDKVGWGVDPELICHATDLAGCDAYAFLQGDNSYDWLGHEFFYDLLHSFRGQSVFNSENHLIPDGAGRFHIPMNYSRSVIWQDGLHHEGSTTIWVWQMTVEQGGLGGSIYFRPANIFGAGRAMLDLNRLGREVQAINNEKPRIALLDSQPSIFWEEKYKSTIMSTYAALNFLGQPVTFVSERELAAGTTPRVDWIIVPEATHILDTTLPALAKFARGGRILLIGEDSLTRDEYDRPLKRPSYPAIPVLEGQAEARRLRACLGGSGARRQPIPFTDLLTRENGPAWGVEYRAVEMDGATMVPMVNLNGKTMTVAFTPGMAQRPAVDLLSGEKVDLSEIKLEPLLPKLLRLAKAR